MARRAACLLALLLWHTPVAQAEPDEKDQAAAVSEAPAAVSDAKEQEADSPPPWYQRLTFSGDFRSRYEGFYEQDQATRNRVRMRLRLRVDAAINDDTQFHLQIASGDPGTPVSTNQTFTEFFLPKPVNLDRALIVYNPRAASAMRLGLGKFPAPQASTQMIFDEDLNLEGGWEQVSWRPNDSVAVNLMAIQTAVDERSSAADAFMLAGYGEVTFTLGAHALQISAANYGWGNVDQIAVGSVTGPLRSILTNAVRSDQRGDVIGYVSRFNVVDVIAEATLRIANPDSPLRVLANFARNTRAATDRDSGVWVEAEYGGPRAAHTWGAAYTYGWVEQDVTPSAFVFSDMPGTNLRLHMVETSYVPLPGLSLDVTLHLTRPLFQEGPRGANRWLSRLHLAAVVRF